MRKSLRRALERLRAATNGVFGKRTLAGGGLREPQTMQPLLVPARSAARR